jgi:hypothetical protein
MTTTITTTNEVSDDLLWGIFVTALEGGIGYWSVCTEYRHSDPETRIEDHTNFYAVVVDTTEHCDGQVVDENGEPTDLLRIDRAVILKGLQAIAAREVKLAPRIHADVSAALGGDAGALDAEGADCVVQAGLFNDVVYG